VPVRFDPDTLAVDRAFTFHDLIDYPDTDVGGIAWDGQAVWISITGEGNTITGQGDPLTSTWCPRERALVLVRDEIC
jgi:hypothetical protein